MTPNELEAEINKRVETRRREYKRNATWDSLKWKVAKTAMALANTRDGGHIIIGVEKQGETHVPTGVTVEHLATFRDDEIVAFINSRADPYVVCEVHRPVIGDQHFVVIAVQQFESLPVLCKKVAVLRRLSAWQDQNVFFLIRAMLQPGRSGRQTKAENDG